MGKKVIPCFGEPREPWIKRFIAKGWTIKPSVRILWESPCYYWDGYFVLPPDAIKFGTLEVVYTEEEL